MNLLKLHKDKLERYCSIINLQREIETLAITIKHLQSGTDKFMRYGIGISRFQLLSIVRIQAC